MKIKYCKLFWILSHFSWANTFKAQEFWSKIENIQQHSKFSQHSYWESLINRPLHHIMKIKDFTFLFFYFVTFSWANTPLKLMNFDQKLKISNNTQNFAQRSYWESVNNSPPHHTMKFEDCKKNLDFVTFFVG